MPALHELRVQLGQGGRRAEQLDAFKEGPALSRMLRAAARRVTTHAPAELSVAEGFIAFAIDGELEGDELAKIPKECGAVPQKLREWKNKGWL